MGWVVSATSQFELTEKGQKNAREIGDRGRDACIVGSIHDGVI
jgi:hypothetical protein